MDYKVTITPLEGTELSAGSASSELIAFEAKDEIVFGREPTSDVVFAPDARVVGRKHFRLYRQPSGDYAIEVFGQRYVGLNGTAAVSGETVSDGDTIQLGDKKGPSFRIGVVEMASGGGLAKTLTQMAVVRSGVQMKRLRNTVAALAVVVIAGGAVGYTLLSGEIDDLSALQTEIQEAVGKEFAPAVIDRIRDSAYAVVMVGSDGARTILGTAWPLGDRWLATNAHVASKYDARHEVMLIAPGGKETYLVSDAWIHPGYQAFKDFRTGEAKADPDFVAATEDLPQPSGFDIALLKVDDATFDKGLEVATEEDVRELGPGVKLAYAGYPVEGTATQRSVADNPEPTVKFGYVSSITDFFLFGAGPDHAFLIRHSIPATGGASGSPIFTPDGKIVAVLSGGTVFDSGGARQPSAVLENFAQRIDLLDAFDEPEAAFDAEAAANRWRNVILPRFSRLRQQVLDDTVAALEKAEPGKAVAETVHLNASLAGPDVTTAGPLAFTDHTIPVKAGQRYAVLAYGETGRSISMQLFRDGKAIGFGGAGTSFATIDYPADQDEVLTLRILGEANDPVDYELYVLTADKPA